MNADKIYIRITIYISFKYYMWYRGKFLYVDTSSKLDFLPLFCPYELIIAVAR